MRKKISDTYLLWAQAPPECIVLGTILVRPRDRAV